MWTRHVRRRSLLTVLAASLLAGAKETYLAMLREGSSTGEAKEAVVKHVTDVIAKRFPYRKVEADEHELGIDLWMRDMNENEKRGWLEQMHREGRIDFDAQLESAARCEVDRGVL